MYRRGSLRIVEQRRFAEKGVAVLSAVEAVAVLDVLRAAAGRLEHREMNVTDEDAKLAVQQDVELVAIVALLEDGLLRRHLLEHKETHHLADVRGGHFAEEVHRVQLGRHVVVDDALRERARVLADREAGSREGDHVRLLAHHRARRMPWHARQRLEAKRHRVLGVVVDAEQRLGVAHARLVAAYGARGPQRAPQQHVECVRHGILAIDDGVSRERPTTARRGKHGHLRLAQIGEEGRRVERADDLLGCERLARECRDPRSHLVAHWAPLGLLGSWLPPPVVRAAAH